MVEKRKLNYKNFNICRLVREGKIKLQYPENLNESKRQYRTMNKQERYKNPIKKEYLDDKMLFIPPEMEERIKKLFCDEKYFMDYVYLKNYGKFVEFEDKITNEKKWFIIFFENGEFIEEKFLGYNIQVEDIESYLINFDMVKSRYSEEELKQVLIKYIELKRNEINNKELIKK